MTAILILLALLSLGTLASRRGYTAAVARVGATPILTGIGFLFLSPTGLAFLDPENADSLRPALRVGCAWLALLVGLSTPRPSLAGFGGKRAAVALTGAAITWALTALALAATVELSSATTASHLSWAQLSPIAIAVLTGGIVQATGLARAASVGLRSGLTGPIRLDRELLPADEGVAVLAVAAAILLWLTPEARGPIYESRTLAVLALVGFGLLLAAAQALISRAENGTEAKIISLLGLVTLLTGMAASTALPAAPIAFIFGVTLSSARTGRTLLRRLAATERPVRVVVLVLVGIHLGLDTYTVILGAAAALARITGKVLMATMGRRAGLDVSLPALIASSKLAVPMTVSVAITEQLVLRTSGLLATVVVAVSVTDLISAALLLLRSQGTPEIEEAEQT